jgi:type IV secretion system protein VirD4
MDDLVSKLTINAGYGFRVVIVLQNLSQLDEVYGKAVRETLVSACATQLYIRIDNLDTSEYLSKMLGETTIELKRASLRRGGILGSKTINTDYDAVPLRTPQQLRQMDPRKVILLVSSAPPFELERVIYHDDRPYRQALEQVRFKSVNVPELEPYADAEPASEALCLHITARPSTKVDVVAAAPITQSVPRSVDEETLQVSTLSPSVARQDVGKELDRPPSDRSVVDANDIPSHSAQLRSDESLPIDAVLAAQIDAGAAAFKQVMQGLPEDGPHHELLEQLQSMVTLHEGFGEDGVSSTG